MPLTAFSIKMVEDFCFNNRGVEKAVKGMLPKNRLGSKLYGNLYVYEGSEHPHAAQQPKAITL